VAGRVSFHFAPGHLEAIGSLLDQRSRVDLVNPELI
jgi:hypothetical protein